MNLIVISRLNGDGRSDKRLIRIPDPPQIVELDMASYRPTEYHVGDYVLRRHPDMVGTMGPVNKYSSWWRGPYLITNVIDHKVFDKRVYQIQNLVTEKIYDVDVMHIKPLYYDPRYVNPLHIAVRDTTEYVVDHIVEHKKMHDTMHWQVRWAGYTPDDDTWEPFDNLKDNEAFQLYCKHNKLHEFLPLQQRTRPGRKLKRNKDA